MAGYRRDKSSGIFCVFEQGGSFFALEYLLKSVGAKPESRGIESMKNRARVKTHTVNLVADNVAAETEEEAIKVATGEVTAKKPAAKKPAAKKPAAKKPAAKKPAAKKPAAKKPAAKETEEAEVEETEEKFLDTDAEI